jgi:hypothetical protein
MRQSVRSRYGKHIKEHHARYWTIAALASIFCSFRRCALQAPKPIVGAEERRVGIEFMKHKVATAVIGLAPRLHLDRSTSEGVIRGMAFVARCSGAATLAYLTASLRIASL